MKIFEMFKGNLNETKNMIKKNKTANELINKMDEEEEYHKKLREMREQRKLK